MEATAKLRYARISPQKCRLVVDTVRGVQVSKALNTLKFMPKKGAELVADRNRGGSCLACHVMGPAVAVGTGEIELAELALRQFPAPGDCGFRRRAFGIDFDGLAIGKVMQIDRHRLVVVCLHQQFRAGCRAI